MAVAVEHPQQGVHSTAAGPPHKHATSGTLDFAHKMATAGPPPRPGPFIALDWEGVNEMRTL